MKFLLKFDRISILYLLNLIIRNKNFESSIELIYFPLNTGSLFSLSALIDSRKSKEVKALKEIIKVEVEDAFDHKNLNIEVPEFTDLNPTTENIAVVIYNKIKPKLDTKFDIEITLYETARNFVTYTGL